MENLNITSRQMCEKIASTMGKIGAEAQKKLSLFCALAVNDYDQITFDDLVDYGIMEQNKALHNFACFTPEDIQVGTNKIISQRVTIFPANIVYSSTNQATISNFLSQVGYTDLVSYFGTPIMNQINSEGHSTIMDYVRANYDGYGPESVAYDLEVTIGSETFVICHYDVNENNVVVCSNYNEEFFSSSAYSLLIGSLTSISCGTNMLVELMSALADGVTSSSDIFSVLNKYITSPISSVANFAQAIVQNGNASAQMAISRITQLFRDSFGDYSENDDGTITWDLNGSKIVSTFFQVALNIVVGAASIVGVVLLYGGTVLSKIVGGAITLAASAIKAVTTTLGQLSGTTPYINDEAIDHCYHDPIAQGKNTIYVDRIDDLILGDLRTTRRRKIVFPCGVLYLYNFIEYNDHTCDIEWKLFPGMDSFSPYVEQLNEATSGTKVAAWSQGNITISQVYNNGYQRRNYSFLPQNSIWQDDIYAGIILGYYNKNLGLNSWKRSHFKAMCNTPVQNLRENSADASKWERFWYTLSTNSICCLALAFCNPRFYIDHDHNISSFDRSVYDLTHLFDYKVGGSYTQLMECVATMANFDHSNDRFFIAVLESLGLYTISGLIPNIYVYTLRVSSQVEDIPQFSWSENLVNTSSRPKEYLEQYVGIFDMLSVDKYCYATPPSYDLTSILWGAIAVAAAVAIVITVVQVTRTIITKKVQFFMQRKGQQLLADGEVFRNGFTQEEYLELSKEDRAIYNRAFKQYQFKVKLYNFVANALHLGTVDWVNNWWNGYEATTPPIISASDNSNLLSSIDSNANAISIIDGYVNHSTDVITADTGNIINTTDNVNTDVSKVIRLISGVNPNVNRSCKSTRDR